MIPKFLRLSDVKARYGISASTVYRRISEGLFPKQVRWGTHAAAWSVEELEAWDRACRRLGGLTEATPFAAGEADDGPHAARRRTVMLPAPSLSDQIKAYVRAAARRFGVATLRPGPIVQAFFGHAGARTLNRLVAAAIWDFKESAAIVLDSPAALEPMRMFDCTPMRMRLTVGGCARLFRGTRERRPDVWEGRYACVACPIGARHAGITMSPVVHETEVLRLVCCRCRRPGTRLINGRFCISCYNRHQEALRGKNARGRRPALSDHLREVGVAVFAGDDLRLETQQFVSGALEIIIDLARKAEGVMSFGWAITGPETMAAAA